MTPNPATGPSSDLAATKRPRGRFTIRRIMGLTLAVAVVVGLFAPELRSIEESGEILLYSLAMAALVLLGFWPACVVLLFFRDRARRGKVPGRSAYLLLAAAYAISLVLTIVPITMGYYYAAYHQ